MACISLRQSIQWFPTPASESTQTVVLSSLKTGAFLDVRFDKSTRKLDWAFAGFRVTELGTNKTRFQHHIDSNTLDPLSVVDIGVNQSLPDGTILESGEMVNPETGLVGKYEEIWLDEECSKGVFVRNADNTTWRACVGRRQLALGRRRSDLEFWAWQAWQAEDGQWMRGYSTDHSVDGNTDFLPGDAIDWERFAFTEWAGDRWELLG